MHSTKNTWRKESRRWLREKRSNKAAAAYLDDSDEPLLIALLLFLIPVGAQNKQDIDYVNQVFYPATVLLYAQDEAGGMRMRCTATAIEKLKDGYTFVTAAHCGAVDDTEHRTVSPEKTFFYITEDSQKDKTFYTGVTQNIRKRLK